MPPLYVVAESQHEIQNPTSREKILLLGERLRLGPGSRVLDVGSGRGGPAILLAGAFGCRITCIEQADEFQAAAGQRVGEEAEEDFLTLPATVERFQAAGLQPVALIDSSIDDWDRYESLHWLAADEWLAAHPEDPDAEEIRTLTDHYRDRYLRWLRDLLGWAMIAGRKRRPNTWTPPS